MPIFSQINFTMDHQLKVIFLTIFLFFSLSSCKVGRFIFYNFADIQDHKKFPARSLQKGDYVFQFKQATEENAPSSIEVGEEQSIPFDRFLEKNKTVAFLIIRNDSIQYERYFKQYDQTSIVPSFSMAKSITSILIGCAIEDQLIGSEEDLVIDYIPELKKNGFEKVIIKHLLQMTSGLRFNEGYTNPFGHAATFYYGLNLRKAIAKLKLKKAPGKSFDYVSGNTQLLGLILERALKDKSITQYLQEKLWTPLQMEYNASWSLDKKKDGLEKTFCCLNARARDFAKIGRLFLNKGNWNGQQIIAQEWVEKSTKLDTSNGSAWFYQYQWWLPTQKGDFMAQGILGQYIYVNPDKNLIIVRLGKAHGKNNWQRFLPFLASHY